MTAWSTPDPLGVDPILGPYVLDWLHLVVRWVHIAAAIAWVGASFYFIALDHSLRSPQDEQAARRGVGGEAWEIHGGGFYRIEKFRVAPAQLPASLRWFKWEAYITWVTGFTLLVLLYYLDPNTFLIDPTVADLQPWQAVGASLALLGGAWLIYDALSRRLGGREGVLAAAIVLLVVTVVWVSSQLFGPRAAFIQAGATLGTWMAANVFFVIIPGQRELVAAKEGAREPDAIHGSRGKQRSVHNNYLTFPVLFAMISQHFPFTYGHEHGWAVLLALMAAGAAAQHVLSIRDQGRTAWPFGVAAIILVVAAAIAVAPPLVFAGLAPRPLTPEEPTEVARVIAARCAVCHSARPTHPSFSAPPKGLALDSREQIRSSARRIYQQVVIARLMPPANQTGLTDAERDLIARWFRNGTPLP